MNRRSSPSSWWSRTRPPSQPCCAYNLEAAGFAVDPGLRRRGGDDADRRAAAGPRAARLDAAAALGARGLPPAAPPPRPAHMPIIMLTARGEEPTGCAASTPAPTTSSASRSRPSELIARIRAVLRRVRPAFAEQLLSFARPASWIWPPTGSIAATARSISARPSSACCAISWSIPAASSRASSCSTGSGARRLGRAAHGRCHIRRLRKALNEINDNDIIRTVRSAGYALDEKGGVSAG